MVREHCPPIVTSYLCPQLEGLEGCRVEAVPHIGEPRRFWVHRAEFGSGVHHFELAYRTSKSGYPAALSYRSVTVLIRP